jgi:hypothetical protein
MNQIDSLDAHTTKPNSNLERSGKTIPPLIGQYKASMSNPLFALKSLLIGDIDDIPRPNIAK